MSLAQKARGIFVNSKQNLKHKLHFWNKLEPVSLFCLLYPAYCIQLATICPFSPTRFWVSQLLSQNAIKIPNFWIIINFYKENLNLDSCLGHYCGPVKKTKQKKSPTTSNPLFTLSADGILQEGGNILATTIQYQSYGLVCKVNTRSCVYVEEIFWGREIQCTGIYF